MPKALSNQTIAEKLRAAKLDAQDWDVPGIAAKTNSWIANNRAELTDAEVTTWTVEQRAEHYDEFGSLAAVDFFEQCVIETAPDNAPWQALRARVDAGEFDTWEPIWVEPKQRDRA